MLILKGQQITTLLQLNVCIMSYRDNCPLSSVNQDNCQGKGSMGHVCTSLMVDRVHKFIIILALLSNLALGAEFNLIIDLHKVITVCHILKQW